MGRPPNLSLPSSPLCSYILDASGSSSRDGSAAAAGPSASQLRSVPSSRSEVFKDRQLSPLQVGLHTCDTPAAAALAAAQVCGHIRSRHICAHNALLCLPACLASWAPPCLPICRSAA
jgi:hypothetical protein